MPTIAEIPSLGSLAQVSASIAGILTVVIVALGTLAWRRINVWIVQMAADVKTTKADVQTTKVQTTNSHQTNMRDDLTLAITEVQGLGRAIKRMETKQTKMEEQQAAMQTQQQAIHEDVRDARRDVRFTTEYVRDVDKRLIQHVDESGKDGGNNG